MGLPFMKYYLHDSNSFNDEKITELFLEFGYEGLGLFYTILEKLANQEKPIKTNVLKSQLKVGKKLEKCWSFMESLDIISSNNGETFNKQLLNYGEKYQIKKEKNKERIKEWREKQEVTENVTRSESVSNTPKVNKSKVNKSKVKIDITENEFLEYCESFLKDKFSSYENPLKAKFQQWSQAEWVDGNGKNISNWKTKAQNIIQYLKPERIEQKKDFENHVLKLEQGYGKALTKWKNEENGNSDTGQRLD